MKKTWEWSGQRIRHWSRVLLPAWRLLFVLPTAVLGGLDQWRGDLLSPETAAKYNVLAYVPHLPWYVWALMTMVVLALLIGEGSYRLSVQDGKERTSIEEKLNLILNDTAKLEFIFDHGDKRCVKDEFYPFNDKPPRSRHWSVGLRNSSKFKSADEIVIVARNSWFVECTIAAGEEYITGRRAAKNPVVHTFATLQPGAEEYVGLFGLGVGPPGDVFKKPHEFVLEARARDVETVRLTLIYEPTEPLATIRAKI